MQTKTKWSHDQAIMLPTWKYLLSISIFLMVYWGFSVLATNELFLMGES